MPRQPILIDASAQRVGILPVQQYDLTVIAVRRQQVGEVALGPHRLRKDDGFALAALRSDLVERLRQCGDQFPALGVIADAQCQLTVALEQGDFRLQPLRIDRRRLSGLGPGFGSKLLGVAVRRVVIGQRLDVGPLMLFQPLDDAGERFRYRKGR